MPGVTRKDTISYTSKWSKSIRFEYVVGVLICASDSKRTAQKDNMYWLI